MVNRPSQITLFTSNQSLFHTAGTLFRLTLLAVFLLAALSGRAAFGQSLPDTKASSAQSGITIMALGDSLTAGYGLPTGDGFVPQLQAWLRDQMDVPVRVVNAGVSGDTTSGGLARLAWSLAGAGNAPDLVILELGANDGLRGIDPARTRENMDAILADFQQRGIKVLVAGMMAPPNLGPDYGADFNSIFPELADKYDVPLYPFFLDGVAADPNLNQDDGIHPTKEGVAIIVDRLGPVVLNAITAR